MAKLRRHFPYLLTLLFALVFAASVSAEEKWKNLVQRAGVAYTNGEYIAAAKILEDAFEEAELAHPTGAQGAAVLNNLAIVLQSRGDRTKAEATFRRALSMWKSRLGPEHVNVAKTLHNLAELKMVDGDLEAAKSLYQEAVGIAENHAKSDPTTLSQVLEGYANVLFDLGQESAASAVRERIKAIPKPIRGR